MSVSLSFRWLLAAPLRQCALVACYLSLLIAGSLSAPAASAEEQQPAKEAAKAAESTASRAESQATIEKLTEQLQKTPDDVDALLKRAEEHRKLSDSARTESDLETALQLDPQRSIAWQHLGDAYLAQRKYHEAITAYGKAIDLGVKTPLLLVDRAMAYGAIYDNKNAIASLTSAIEIDPNCDVAFLTRAQAWSTIDQNDKAAADFKRALELKPRDIGYLTARAHWYFKQHEIDRGLEDIKEAIKLNPGDLGVDYQPSSDNELSAESLAHGEAQVEQMLKDRPEMAKHVSKGDKIWTWAVRKFAGEDLGSLVDWDASSPAPFNGCSLTPTENRHACIQVNSNEEGRGSPFPANFDTLWKCAVFELNNVASTPEWEKIWSQATGDKLGRDEYIVEMLRSEEIAVQKTRAFYINCFVPWISSKKVVVTNPLDWPILHFVDITDENVSLATWAYDLRIPHYAAAYDLVRAQQEYQRENFTKVKELVTPYIEIDDSISIYTAKESNYWLGCADWRLNDLDSSVKHFTTALRLVPGDADVLLNRGKANALLSHFDEALVDFNEAVRNEPKLSSAYLERGYEHLRRGKLEAAFGDAEKVLEIGPQADGYLLRAQVWEAKEDFAKAMPDYAKAVELAPKTDYTYRYRANSWYLQKEYEKCLADCETLIQLNPKDDEAIATRGWVLFLKKSYTAALDDLNRAIELNPKSLTGLSSRAELLLTCDDLSLRDTALGFESAKQCCDLTDWKEPHALSVMAQGYAAKQDWGNAIKWQKKALEDPDPEYKARWEKALERFQQGANRSGESPAKCSRPLRTKCKSRCGC